VPFPPTRVLEVYSSRAPSIVCEVALSSFDTGIGFQDSKLVLWMSFEMNRQQCYKESRVLDGWVRGPLVYDTLNGENQPLH
jgi:hypothetical protein